MLEWHTCWNRIVLFFPGLLLNPACAEPSPSISRNNANTLPPRCLQAKLKWWATEGFWPLQGPEYGLFSSYNCHRWWFTRYWSPPPGATGGTVLMGTASKNHGPWWMLEVAFSPTLIRWYTHTHTHVCDRHLQSPRWHKEPTTQMDVTVVQQMKLKAMMNKWKDKKSFFILNLTCFL